MSKLKTPVIIKSNLYQHPVVIAWSSLKPQLPAPEVITYLKKSHKTQIIKLVCEQENGYSIIGKGTSSLRASIEKSIYESIFKYLPEKGLQYYGCIESENDFAWNFMEDARGIPFSFKNPKHLRLAEDWCAILHTHVPKLDFFPKLDMNHYNSCLLSGYDTIMANLSNRALSNSDLDLLKSIISHLDILQKRWEKVNSIYDQMPKGFIHGDFLGKNLRVRNNSHESKLVVFDWENCGWGLPGVDIFKLNLNNYWLKVRHHWKDITLGDIKQMSNLGKLLRTLVAIDWVAVRLSYEYIRKPIYYMEVYEESLAETIQYID